MCGFLVLCACAAIEATDDLDIVSRLVDLLDSVSSWIAEYPPAESSSRYGNVSFRLWQRRLHESALSLCEELLPDSFKVRGASLKCAAYVQLVTIADDFVLVSSPVSSPCCTMIRVFDVVSCVS